MKTRDLEVMYTIVQLSLDEIEKRLDKLEKNSHPKRDFVTCDCCKKMLTKKKEK